MKIVAILHFLVLIPLFLNGRGVKRDTLVVESRHFEVMVVREFLQEDSMHLVIKFTNMSNETFGIDTLPEMGSSSNIIRFWWLKNLNYSFVNQYILVAPGQSFSTKFSKTPKFERANITLEYILDYSRFPYILLNERKSFSVKFGEKNMNLTISTDELPANSFAAFAIKNIDLVDMKMDSIEIENY